MKKEGRQMRVQWVFVFFGTILAIIAGLVVNAAYDLLKSVYSPGYIFSITALMLFVLVNILFFFFDTFEESTSESEDEKKFMRRYFKNVRGRISGFFHKKKAKKECDERLNVSIAKQKIL